MNRATAIQRYFEHLAEGDPYALGLTFFFVFLFVVIALIAWRIHVLHKREDEQRHKKFLKRK